MSGPALTEKDPLLTSSKNGAKSSGGGNETIVSSKCTHHHHHHDSSNDSNSKPSRISLFLRFLAFTLAFSLAETSVVAAISVASSVLGKYGSLSVGALYATFAIGTLFAGSIVRASDGNLRPLLLASVAGMGAYNLACLAVALHAGEFVMDDGDGHKLIPLSKGAGLFLVAISVVSGIADGMIWPAVGAYITMTAQTLSVDDNKIDSGGTEEEEGDGNNTTPKDNTRWDYTEEDRRAPDTGGISGRINSYLPYDFHILAGTLTGMFNVIFLLALLLGHVYTAYAFRVDSFDGVVRAYSQIAVLTVAGVSIMFWAMAPRKAEIQYEQPCCCADCPGHGGSPPKNPSPLSGDMNPVVLAVGLTFAEPALYHLVPSHVAYGLIDGLVLGYVARTLVPNAAAVGALASVKTVTAASATPILTAWGNGPTKDRVNVVLYGNVAYLLCVILVGINLYIDSIDRSEGWLWSNLALIYILDGLGFSAWQTTTSGALLSEIAPALVGGDKSWREKSYENPAEITAAVFAGCKATSGTATAVAFFISPLLPGWAIIALGITAGLVAMWAIRDANAKGVFTCKTCMGWSFAHFRGKRREE